MADGSVAQPLPGLTRAPRCIDYTLPERELIVGEVIARLMAGEPLADICRSEGMPSDDRVRVWSDTDPALAHAIARAREHGYDRIAQDTLLIADGLKPVVTDKGQVLQSDAKRDKLRVETRLRLLAKWDPKRYGEAVQMRMADANGEKLDTTPMIRELLALVRPADGSQAVVVEGTAVTKKEPPAG